MSTPAASLPGSHALGTTSAATAPRWRTQSPRSLLSSQSRLRLPSSSEAKNPNVAGSISLNSSLAATIAPSIPSMPAAAIEPVEPQSLKKLSFKSLKRALDIFSLQHGHCMPSDPKSKRIRISYKLNAEYGSVKDLLSNQGYDQVGNDAKFQGDKAPISSALALPGYQDIRDPQNSGNENAIMPGPTLPPKALDAGSSGRSIGGALISVFGSTESASPHECH